MKRQTYTAPKEFKFVKKQTRILRYYAEVISTRFPKSDLLQHKLKALIILSVFSINIYAQGGLQLRKCISQLESAKTMDELLMDAVINDLMLDDLELAALSEIYGL